MTLPKRPFRNIILPAVILLALLVVMVGCLYIPTPEHTLLSGTKQDFRKWAVEHKDNPPQNLAMITQSSIEAMFGKPAFASENGRCTAYVMGTENSIEIWPLCFGAGFANGQTHVLKLVFGDGGRLKRVVPLSADREPPMYWFGMNTVSGTSDPLTLAGYLLRDADQNCPKDEVIEDLARYSIPSSQPVPILHQ